MNLDEIEGLKIKLEKAMKNGNSNLALDHLACLLSFEATEESLRSSKIAIFLSQIKRHENSNKEIAASCKALVEKWKAAVRTSVKDVPNRRDSSVCILSSKSIANPDSPDNSGGTSPVLCERTLALDKVDIQHTGNGVRDNCIGMLYTSLGLGSNDKSSLIVAKAAGIEVLVFKKHGQVDGAYKSRIRSIFMNLKDKSNPDLRESILSGALSIEAFSEMTVDVYIFNYRKWHQNSVNRKPSSPRNCH